MGSVPARNRYDARPPADYPPYRSDEGSRGATYGGGPRDHQYGGGRSYPENSDRDRYGSSQPPPEREYNRFYPNRDQVNKDRYA